MNADDSISVRLNSVMANRDFYTQAKEQRINDLRQLLSLTELPPLQLYDVNLKLYEEFRKYRTDSAVVYIRNNRQLAVKMKRDDLRYQSELLLVWLYSTRGMYIEAKEILESIDKSRLSEELTRMYYYTYMEFYSHYGQATNLHEYYTKSGVYRDSLLTVLTPGSLEYDMHYASKLIYEEGYHGHGNSKTGEEILLELLDKTTDEDEERAMIAYVLGHLYKETTGDIELRKKYYSISAIADIVNSTKDNASLQSLALLYYEQGNIDRAYQFIQAALDDAVLCNVRYRAMEASEFYPIINSSYQEKEYKRKKELQYSLISISILSICLIIGLIFIFKQVNRLSGIRKKLYNTNLELRKINGALQQSNENLNEANHVKEQYIAHFFDLCSDYIDKMEEYRKNLNTKARNNQLEELYKMLKSNLFVENELNELYKNFDSIFLNIYPTFVEEFNKLLTPGEEIYPKSNELLNTELRIFALIRLGITDSVKIAGFLRYSLRTVYNYRTKVRNKAAVSRDEFEEIVKKIGTFQPNVE